MSKMRAAVLNGPRNLRIVWLPVPDPGPGEVRVRLEGTGVCASNLATWEGMPWTRYPSEPGALGHEAWGRVDAVGSGVTSVQMGARVGLLSDHAYAEYEVVPQSRLVPLPASLDGQDFPAEALGCAMNIFRRSEIERGQTVAVVGVGFLGAILTRLASNAGARVIAITRRPFALELASRFGASELIPMDDHCRIVQRVSDLTKGKLCERVIEAVGKQWPLDLASELTAEGGRLMIAGYHQDGPRQVNMQLWNWRGIDVINAHERSIDRCMQGMRAAIDSVTSGVLDPSPLYTHRFSLDRLDEAFEATLNRPDGFLKALVIHEQN